MMTAQNELDKNALGGTELLGERLTRLIDPNLLDKFQIIRSRFRGFDESKKFHIFWEHDLAQDPESENVFNNQSILDRLDAIVFVSNWQKETFFNAFPKIPKKKCLVIRNAIDPIDARRREKTDDKIHLIYTPTPHRGLEILVPVFAQLCKEFPNRLHLDVYSSFKLYGWEERDRPYQQVFDAINSHPDMTNHGTVSNDEIRKALLRSDIFAYPSIWQETSCLCLIEAMSAECLCVTSDLAALPETSGGLILTYPYSGDLNQEATHFYVTLKNLITMLNNGADNDLKNLVKLCKLYADFLHNTSRMKFAWEGLLTTIENAKNEKD